MKKARNSKLGNLMGLRGQSPDPEFDPSNTNSEGQIITYKNSFDVDTTKPHSLLLGLVDALQY